ncbi:mating pair formation protein [Pseudomonas helleri]|uniref:Mating pair formation protein n=1 Tax=Pseudomonas helleri TaxID=1608996 RepID=A0A6G1W929_9PSED|nr:MULTISPECIES: type IV secretion system protein [Pseudomonas]MQT27557.1 mating pair formation protein [Pseudomonas helleri]MQU18945.1 mating pair formation protein [Pseudomonas helleri]PAA33089.1 mating pair formation protein [Pseudomonas fragi]
MDKTFKNDEALRRKTLREGQKVKQERNRSLFLNGAQAISIVALACAVYVLSDLHTVIPVVTTIGADNEVLRMRVIDKENVSAEQALVESDLYSFVEACNTFDPRRKQALSDMCHLYTTPDVARQYEQEINPDNPTNPYAVLGEKEWIESKAYSINKVGDTYQVSFVSNFHQSGKPEPVATTYIANLKIANTLVPRSLGERWVNPLGTVVTVYRKSEELNRR